MEKIKCPANTFDHLEAGPTNPNFNTFIKNLHSRSGLYRINFVITFSRATMKENMKLVRSVNRLNRRGEHISDNIIKDFTWLANQYKTEEKTENAPLRVIIQIFA